MANPVMAAVTVAVTLANMAMTASRKIEGPRTTDTLATLAQYGTPLTHFYGTRRIDGLPVIFAEPMREVKQRRKTKGGKYNEYTYYGTWAVAVAAHEIDAITRIWFDRNLIYDTTGAGPITPFDLGNGQSITEFFRIYLGTQTQEADPRMQATVDAEHGPGSCPAYRGTAYIMFEEVPLEKLGNRFPQISVEATRNFTAINPTTSVSDRGLDATGGRVLLMADGALTFTFGTEGWNLFDNATQTRIAQGEPPETSEWSNVGSDVWGDSILVNPLSAGGEIAALDPLSGAVSTLFSPVDPGDGAFFFWTFGDDVFWYRGSAGQIYGTGFSDATQWGVSIVHIRGFLKDYESGQVYALGAYSNSVGMIPVGSGGGTTIEFPFDAPADPDNVFVWGKGLATGHWLFVVRGMPDDDAVRLALYDPATETFVATHDCADLIQGEWVVKALNVEARSAFFGREEISLIDLSVIRTVTGLPANAIYDATTHALMGSQLGGGMTWTFLDRGTGGSTTLQTIFDDITTRVGLTPGTDTDSDALAEVEVQGYSWTQTQAKAILEPLFDAYDFDLRPHGYILEALERGQAPAGTITTPYMGATTGDTGPRYTVTATLDTDLPAEISLSFADPALDQQTNTAIARRPSTTTDSARSVSIDLSTWVATPDEGRQLAERYLRRRWIGAETIETALGRRHIGLEPGDVWSLDLDGTVKTARLTRMEVGANGVIATTWERDRAGIHTLSGASGADGDGHVPPVVALPGLSKGFILDTPLRRDADDGLIMYYGAASVGAGTWPGADIYIADEDGNYSATWATVASDSAATWGATTTALSDADAHLWDRASSVTVTMNSGELSSITTAQALADPTLNLALIGDELVQFTTATLIAANTYTLSGFLRGRRGTEWAMADHASGERFVLMDSSIAAQTMGASDINTTDSYKAVTVGRSSGLAQSVTYTGASLKPYAPAHVEGTRDGSGNLSISWVRRTRVGGAWRDGSDALLGETSEAYEVDIMDGADVAHTITGLASPAATFSAADQTTYLGAPQASITVRVYQLSATAGRGFAAEATL